MDSSDILAGTRLPTRAFYGRDTVEVARDLLGTILLHRTAEGVLAGRIVEVEAYLGNDDPAAHSSAGRTRRTAVIFGPPGRAYVYRIYGMYRCLNVVVEPDGSPGCVLVRALEPVCGVSAMRTRRNTRRLVNIANGPGKLTIAMGIGMDLYGADLTDSPLTIRIPKVAPKLEIETSTRIGIKKAARLPLRFLVANNTYVSRG